MFYHKVKCFKILKKFLKILILYWLPTNIYILDIKYKLHLTMLGKKFWLKKIFYIRHLCFKSVLSHNVKKNQTALCSRMGESHCYQSQFWIQRLIGFTCIFFPCNHHTNNINTTRMFQEVARQMMKKAQGSNHQLLCVLTTLLSLKIN